MAMVRGLTALCLCLAAFAICPVDATQGYCLTPYQMVKANPDLSTFATLIDSVPNGPDMLSNGDFSDNTVLAPTNAAFQSIGFPPSFTKGDIDAFFLAQNVTYNWQDEAILSIIQYHVIYDYPLSLDQIRAFSSNYHLATLLLRNSGDMGFSAQNQLGLNYQPANGLYGVVAVDGPTLTFSSTTTPTTTSATIVVTNSTGQGLLGCNGNVMFIVDGVLLPNFQGMEFNGAATTAVSLLLSATLSVSALLLLL